MAQIYLVVKTYGDYDGSSDEVLHSYSDRADADAHVTELENTQNLRLELTTDLDNHTRIWSENHPRPDMPKLHRHLSKQQREQLKEKAKIRQAEKDNENKKMAADYHAEMHEYTRLLQRFQREVLAQAGAPQSIIEEFDKCGGYLHRQEFSYHVEPVGLD